MYTLALNTTDWKAIRWVGGRYGRSNALINSCLGDIEEEGGNRHLTKPQAWKIAEGFESDTEGGHRPFPCLDPNCSLVEKLQEFWDSIV